MENTKISLNFVVLILCVCTGLLYFYFHLFWVSFGYLFFKLHGEKTNMIISDTTVGPVDKLSIYNLPKYVEFSLLFHLCT